MDVCWVINEEEKPLDKIMGMKLDISCMIFVEAKSPFCDCLKRAWVESPYLW